MFADLGEGNPRAETNLRDLVFGKQELPNKVLETDVEAFRPRIEGRVEDVASGGEGACEVFYGDAASSLDPDEAKAASQRRVNARDAHPENERYAFRCWMLKMGLVGDEYRSMRRRFPKRLSGDSATKALRSKS